MGSRSSRWRIAPSARYQARFFDVFRKFSGRLLSSDESPMIAKGARDRDKLVPMSFPDLTAFGKSEFSG
jgi:uncharacterized protein (DUF1330 family)